MNIQQKFFPPVFLALIILGCLGSFLMKRELANLKQQLYKDILIAKQNEINSLIKNTADNALRQASLFTQDPRVIEAFEIAHSGNINNESDPKAQESRELLRLQLQPLMMGYEQIMTSKFKLHFHLSNGRSLVRMWQDKQTKRNGNWVDISDDLTSFRKTIMDVNTSGKIIKGIELGRGGFEIRGIAPIKSFQGKQLGSVEVLEEFNNLLENSLKQDHQSEKEGLFLYMNAELLNITTSLQDPQKYSVLDNKYVNIYSTKTNYGQEFIETNLLDQGRTDLAFQEFTSLVLGVFPVLDYQGKQIGLIVYSFDVTTQQQLITQILLTMIGTLMAILMLLALIIWLITTQSIMIPLQKINTFINQVKRGDKQVNLQLENDDEIGKMGLALKQMVLSQRQVIGEIQQLADQVIDCTTELSVIVQNQETAVDNQVISTDQVVKFVENITTVANNLVNTMKNVDLMLANAVNLANHSQQDLTQMTAAIKEMEKGSLSISGKLNIINDNALNINSVVTTISKIAEQTNLLSLNASIEAEKAGEYGRGFAVVAREMRRLADQTAVKTLEIETIIEAMKSAVNAGVMEMDKFISEVQNNLIEVNRISGELTSVIHQVQILSPSFDQVNIAIKNQSENAQEINYLILDLNQKMLLIRTSLYNSSHAIDLLNNAAKNLQEEQKNLRLKS